MPKHEAARTLVKSPPELWEVCSDPAALSRHLEPFGEIRITRLEPETTVAWEGERASGTVRIEPSGWGTRVTLTAAPVGGEEPEEPPPGAAATPPHMKPASLVAVRPARRGLLGRLFGRRGAPPQAPIPPPRALEPTVVEPAPVPVAPRPAPPTVPVAEPSAKSPAVDAAAVLDAALDSLGAAHHRPFSRG